MTKISTEQWLGFEPGTTPTSTTLHPDFIRLIQANTTWLDVGCCSGRISRKLTESDCVVFGVDINHPELIHGMRKNSEDTLVHYTQASGDKLPIADNGADGAVLMAILGGVDLQTRPAILQDTLRSVRRGGLVYAAEFLRITDPSATTSDGKLWKEVYQDDAFITGEVGTVNVMQKDGSIMFSCHHFTQKELGDLFIQNGVTDINIRIVNVATAVSGNIRPTLNIWGIKS